MAGYGTDNNIDRNFYKSGVGAVWGGVSHKFNEKTSFNLQASADDDKNLWRRGEASPTTSYPL